MKNVEHVVTISGYKKYLETATLADLNTIKHIRNGIARYDFCNDRILYAMQRGEKIQKIKNERNDVLKATAKNIFRVMGEELGDITLSEAGEIIEAFLSLDLDSVLSTMNQA